MTMTKTKPYTNTKTKRRTKTNTKTQCMLYLLKAFKDIKCGIFSPKVSTENFPPEFCLQIFNQICSLKFFPHCFFFPITPPTFLQFFSHPNVPNLVLKYSQCFNQFVPLLYQFNDDFAQFTLFDNPEPHFSLFSL